MITRRMALALIAQHGWAPDDPTAIDCVNRVIPDSTFDHEMGVHTHYSRRAVYAWLGY